MIKQALRLIDLNNIPDDNGSSFQNDKSVETLIKSAIKNGEIDASIIIEQWFSKVKADVFISHSGADHSKIKALANRLKQKGYTPFVDSLFWGNIYELIDEEFRNIQKNGGSLTFATVRKVCADFYMILSLQLVKMVEDTPVFLFADTNNSRNSKILGNTTSPWIYLELETAARVFPHSVMESILEYSSVSFPVNANWMTEIRMSDINSKFPQK